MSRYIQQALNQESTNWRHGSWAVRPLFRHPASNRNVFQLDAMISQPVDCQWRVNDEESQHILIIELATVFVGFPVEVIDVVNNAMLELNVGLGGVHPRRCSVGITAKLFFFFQYGYVHSQFMGLNCSCQTGTTRTNDYRIIAVCQLTDWRGLKLCHFAAPLISLRSHDDQRWSSSADPSIRHIVLQ